MEQKVFFSIIIPTLNQANYFEICLKSIWVQEYKNYELLVMDGGSTDGTLDILKKYNSRITHWRSEKDDGTFDAINEGLQIMSGEWWLVLGSDDVLLPGALSEAAQTIKRHPQLQWITGGIHELDAKGKVHGKFIPKPPNPVAGLTFLNRCWIYHPSTFLHQNVYHQYGGFDNTDIMDYAYWLRLEKAGKTPFIVPNYLAGLRFHADCKSMDFEFMHHAFLKLKNKYAQQQDLSSADRKELNRNMTDTRWKIVKYRSLSHVLANKKIAGLREAFFFIIRHPAYLFKRKFWGLIKRIMYRFDDVHIMPFHHLRYV